MTFPRLHNSAFLALIAFSCVPGAKASLLTFDLINPSSEGIIAELKGSVDNVSGVVTTTWIVREGDFLDGTYEFAFNAGDPSRGPVIEQQLQNIVFFDPVATLSHATTFTASEGPG